MNETNIQVAVDVIKECIVEELHDLNPCERIEVLNRINQIIGLRIDRERS